jgi:hypothetical protein
VQLARHFDSNPTSPLILARGHASSFIAAAALGNGQTDILTPEAKDILTPEAKKVTQSQAARQLGQVLARSQSPERREPCKTSHLPCQTGCVIDVGFDNRKRRKRYQWVSGLVAGRPANRLLLYPRRRHGTRQEIVQRRGQ